MNTNEIRNTLDNMDTDELAQVLRIMEKFLSLSPEKKEEALTKANEIMATTPSHAV